MKQAAGINSGFTLTELLVAGLIVAFLMLGMVQMAAATGRGLHLIESLSETQQGGRFAVDQLRDEVMAAGFHPAPWLADAPIQGISEDSEDGGSDGSDVLTLRRWSDHNCYGNFNATIGDDGQPAFFLRQSTFERTASGNLAHTCHYGPDGGPLVRQINREGLVRRVESFQVLYAEDTDGDRRADRQVRAGNWTDVNRVLGVDIGVLVATEEPLGEVEPLPMMVLDQAVTPRPDGRLRRVWTTTIPLGFKLR